jgi:hypothetical protein
MARAPLFLPALVVVAFLWAVVSPAAFCQVGQSSGAAPGTQSTPPTFPPGTARQPGSNDSKPPESKAAGKTRSFVGTIVKETTGYSLRVGDLSYQLDDQNQAGSHAGQSVKVFGTLDKQTNTIQIKQIEQLSPPST